jgi:Tol biopolymer transport system component
MGEVYKALDTRLNRTVAIKVLPPHFADDPEMKQRFDREAQTIAGLNHPHICTLHDVGEQDGVRYLVMEHLEGQTLAERLTRGAMPLDEALKVAGEIVDALDKAHRQGVVHRDLKPQNIMLVRGAGSSAPSSVKLLDFGLAKWAASGQEGITTAQTRMEVTAQGAIIGTMQYMAPEQVEGKEADTRTDLFAFGAVLYEMMTGKKAFEGKSQASLIGAIMKAEPRPVSHGQPMAPAALDRVVRRCLAKDPEERWQTAHDLMVQLAWIGRGRTEVTISPAAAAAERKRNRLMLIVTTCALIFAAALAVPAAWYLRGSAPPDPLQFRHTILGLSSADISLSPDGRTIAFVAKPDTVGATTLFVRGTGEVSSRKLAGTDNASQPFWSHDSQSIAFVVGDKLRKIDVVGGVAGAVKDLTEAPGFSGGAWSPAGGGTILFGTPKGLNRVSAQGGPAQTITELGQGEIGHFWPSFLPDGTHYLYLAWSAEAGTRAVYVGTLDSRERTKLMSEESNAWYADPGYILFRRKGILFAQPFNASSLALTGDPIQLAGGVAANATGRGVFSASQNGTLIYFQGAAGGGPSGRGQTVNGQFGFVDRVGGRREVAMDTFQFGDMDLSPDGKLIATTRQDTGATGADIWVFEWEKNVPWRLTTDPSDDVGPVWSPDNTRIAFTTYRKGNADIYVKNAHNVGDETPLLDSALNESVEDWSKDGKYLAYECGQDVFQDICVVPFDADGKPGKPIVVVSGKFQKNEPQFSYDGKWLAYTADVNEPGKFQVYVMSFPAGDIKQQISTDGGGQPRWRKDGKEIFFRTLDNRMMASSLTLGSRIDFTVPKPMFNALNTNPTSGDPMRHMWAALPDGERFLTRIGPGVSRSGGAGTAATLNPQFAPAGQATSARGTRGAPSSGLTVIMNWPSVAGKGGK